MSMISDGGAQRARNRSGLSAADRNRLQRERGAQTGAARGASPAPMTGYAEGEENFLRQLRSITRPLDVPDDPRVPEPDSRMLKLSEEARQTDLPRVNNPVTDDEYRFYTQNRDRPYLNPTQQDMANDVRVSDISRRLQREQNFLNKYIDRPYLNPTEEDRANDAMVNAILSRIDRFGGR